MDQRKEPDTGDTAADSTDGGDLAAVAAHVVRAARDRFGVRRAALFWRRAGSDRLVCIASAGEGGAERWLGRSLAAGVGMAGRAVAEGRPVWSPDLLADPNVPMAPWLREQLQCEDLHSVAAAPLRVGGVVRGALGLLDGPGRSYDDEDLRRFAGLADRAARDLEQAIASAHSRGAVSPGVSASTAEEAGPDSPSPRRGPGSPPGPAAP